jgi:hypothetical protein
MSGPGHGAERQRSVCRGKKVARIMRGPHSAPSTHMAARQLRCRMLLVLASSAACGQGGVSRWGPGTRGGGWTTEELVASCPAG